MSIVVAMLAIVVAVGIVAYLGPLAVLLAAAGVSLALCRGWRFEIVVHKPRRTHDLNQTV